MAEKRKVVEVETEEGVMEIMPIGAGGEVGRSCIIVKFKGKIIMLDCGIHPAFAGLPALPFFDEIADILPHIDLCLISHFHLDHAAAIPYLTEKTAFKGRIFMTHPTKAVFKLLLSDYVKVSHHLEDNLYDDQDLQSSLDKIERVNYHEEVSHNGIKFHCYNAGHVLGAAMFMIDIAGVKILYTGDFSKYDDRHLVGAENPAFSPDVLIIESTYGTQVHEPRLEREARFTRFVHRTVSHGGRCLIPVFALGRAQELLLILEEHWKRHPGLHHVPIYYASSLAKRCMTVFQTYINMMNKQIQRQFEVSNPFMFRHIKDLKSAEHFTDSGPSVVMCSPAMLQSGLSRELFERWCSDSKNGIIIPGYTVEGTLAKHIMTDPPTITTMNGEDVPLRINKEYTSFSAHSDYAQTSEFIRDIKPKHIVFVHGDPNEMKRLRDRLEDEIDTKMEYYMPRNTERVRIEFQGEKMAKIVGSLADKPLKEGDEVKGLLIGKDFEHSIVAEEDLKTLFDIPTTEIGHRQLVPLHAPFGLLAHVVSQMYDACLITPDKSSITVHDIVTLTVMARAALPAKYRARCDLLLVEWRADPFADMIADSLLALALQIESNPMLMQQNVREEAIIEHENIQIVLRLLRHHFGEAQYNEGTGLFEIPTVYDGAPSTTTVNHVTQEVESVSPAIRARVIEVLGRAHRALYPLA